MNRISVQSILENPMLEGRVFCIILNDSKDVNPYGSTKGAKGVYLHGPSKSFWGIDERLCDFKIVWFETDDKVDLIQNDDGQYIPMKKIIHINRNIIQKNQKHGTEHPICRVEENGKVRYCMEVKINGPSHMIYNPKKPRPCGARLWIETDSDIELIGEKIDHIP